MNANPCLAVNQNECCGCTACQMICPSGAITMKADACGFLYPAIEREACIGCGKCETVCAFQQSVKDATGVKKDFHDRNCYAVKHPERQVRRASQSGGAFAALAAGVLKEKGVVFGCALNEQHEAVHRKISEVSEIEWLHGAKYVQSRKGSVFQEVKRCLMNGQRVLFSGTQCEVAALKAYLNLPFEDRLLCVSIICYGVPSPLVWQRYVEWQEKKKHGKCVHADFRNKRKYGWKSSIETLTFRRKNGREFKRSSMVYSNMYLRHCMLRPSCYQCPYKEGGIGLVGDVLIGDCWNLERKEPSFDDNMGASIVIINSPAGEKAWSVYGDSMEKKALRYSDYLQPALVSPAKLSDDTPRFWDDFARLPFNAMVKKYGRIGVKRHAGKLFRIAVSQVKAMARTGRSQQRKA